MGITGISSNLGNTMALMVDYNGKGKFTKEEFNNAVEELKQLQSTKQEILSASDEEFKARKGEFNAAQKRCIEITKEFKIV